mmetsp:Transcript_46730/g.92279  ORF Transcript_46730/g.92279 Transcript_46730/m.92279 type:complete len:82 (+) Transcript_46730:1076-1321(+)
MPLSLLTHTDEDRQTENTKTTPTPQHFWPLTQTSRLFGKKGKANKSNHKKGGGGSTHSFEDNRLSLSLSLSVSVCLSNLPS